MVKNTIDAKIVSLIPESDTVIEYLNKIKSQFYDSLKACYSADKATNDTKVL
jgi:hypothetical protein